MRAVRKEESQYLLKQYNLSKLPDMEDYQRDQFLKNLAYDVAEEEEAEDSGVWTDKFRDFLAQHQGE